MSTIFFFEGNGCGLDLNSNQKWASQKIVTLSDPST